MSEYIRDAEKIQNDKSLTVHQQRHELEQLRQKRNKISNKSSSSYSDEQVLEDSKRFIHKFKSVIDSNSTQQDKKERNIAIMDEENKAIRYKKKVEDVGSAGHNRNFQSTDETGTKTSTKGLTKDYTAPNLGVYDRSQRFEGKSRRPMGLDGSTDYEEKAHSDLEVPIGQGLEPALGDPNKAPEASTRIQDIGPYINPVSSQREDSNVNPFSKLSSPPATPRKRDKIKNLFKKKP